MHVLRRQLLHSHLVIVDRAVDHVGFLLLQHDHTALDGVLDAEASDDARAFLTDTMTAVCRLPFCGWVPPSVDIVSSFVDREKGAGTRNETE